MRVRVAAREGEARRGRRNAIDQSVAYLRVVL